MGHPLRLIHTRREQRPPAPTRQDPAIVLCGGGEPLVELALARGVCASAGFDTPFVIVGNDQIAHYEGAADIGVTLHPEKLKMWQAQRVAGGHPPVSQYWTHRPFPGINRWTRDWSGSTGLFCVKIARELGFVHVILCGVPMTVMGKHFVRNEPWVAAEGFRRGWNQRLPMLNPYVRSLSGWTLEKLGEPTAEWLSEEIKDRHPVTNQGLKA